ncbi:natterin-4-like [Bactrocera neohumeralis]|uniref:natterin-4-like n=1 Tax=Bactrocera neohumeralis TaxID=98809 RepID=UPI002165BF8D|nr:natterin-4-like [Bactrocera neohumeralis]
MQSSTPSSNCELVPPGAFVGGRDCDGSPIYVGRSFHRKDNLPAKVIPSKGCAYVCWRGEEIKKRQYEVLVGDGYEWVTSRGGSVPRNAVPGGTTRHGEPLYIGRCSYHNSLTVGKIHPSHGCLYIPFDGKELRFHSYEVLIMKADRRVGLASFQKSSASSFEKIDLNISLSVGF